MKSRMRGYGKAEPRMHWCVALLVLCKFTNGGRKVRAELVVGHAPRNRPVVELVTSKNKLVI